MIDLRRLRVLRAVAHYGTITAAARAMHFTTSAASQQVRQLGRELGVVLLEPNGRNVRLTEAARTLLAHADAIEARWEQAEIDLRSAKDEPAGLLRLCSMPTAVSRLLAPAVAPLTTKYPRLTLQLREVEQPQAFDLLFAGEVDLAVIEVTPANPPLTDARFDQRPLTDDVFDLVVPAGHPKAADEEVDLAAFATEDWIISSTACTCRETHPGRLRRGGLHPTHSPRRTGMERDRAPHSPRPGRRSGAQARLPAAAPARDASAARRPTKPQDHDLHPRRRLRQPSHRSSPRSPGKRGRLTRPG